MNIQKVKQTIERKEKELVELKKQLELEESKNNWVKFTYNGKTYEVQKELNPKCKYKDIIIPKGCQLMTVEMAGYIFDNDIVKLSTDWEWVEHYSKKNKDLGYGCVVSLYSGRGFGDGRLVVYGSGWCDGGFAFCYRLIREVQDGK